MANNDALIVENARIIFTNFTGKGSQYNREGNRNFCVIISDEKTAKDLKKEGWNVKSWSSGDDDEQTYYISVNLSYAINPPDVTLVNRNERGKIVSKVRLTEDTVAMLDAMRIDYADITINPYHWKTAGGTGIKGYVRKMYVNVTQDSYESKYEDISEDDDDELELPF